MARKKTAQELKAEARKLLQRARQLEEKKMIKIGKWVKRNEDKITPALPADLQDEFKAILHD